MGVSKYQLGSAVFWKVDEWLPLPDGRIVRFRKKKVPTKEQALALAAKARADAFEGRYFAREKASALAVSAAWDSYSEVSKRDNDAWLTDKGRAKHLNQHLGTKLAASLTQADVDSYRNRRLEETTQRNKPPTPATLDREVELLKRMLNYAVACGRLPTNPIARVKLLRKPNVRRSVVDEGTFAKLVASAEPPFKPIFYLAYDTGMRKREVLDLKWGQLDLKQGVIRLAPQDTKGEEARPVYLTGRVRAALDAVPVHIRSDNVFVNPETEKAWVDIRKMFSRACEGAGLKGIWFHDLRRSFVTNARRRGVPESVVMKMSGHRTRAVFDRYNIVSEDDLRAAVTQIERGADLASKESGHDLDTLRESSPRKTEGPTG